MQFRWPVVFERSRSPRAGSARRARQPRPTGGARTRFELTRAAQPEPKRHLPWRGIVRGVLAASIIGALAYGGAWFYFSDTVRVQQLSISGVDVVDPYAVAAAADLDATSLLTADLDGATARIEALPGVASATVSRDWPRGVAIAIEERQGWGYWQATGRRVMVDERGQPLDLGRPPAAGAPTIIDIAAPADLAGGIDVDADTVQLVASLINDGTFERLGVEPSGYVFRRDRGLTVVVDGAPDAVFGDSTNYAFKVSTWSAVLEQLSTEELFVAEIDLRFGRNVVLR